MPAKHLSKYDYIKKDIQKYVIKLLDDNLRSAEEFPHIMVLSNIIEMINIDGKSYTEKNILDAIIDIILTRIDYRNRTDFGYLEADVKYHGYDIVAVLKNKNPKEVLANC
jgi:hypothetical protein